MKGTMFIPTVIFLAVFMMSCDNNVTSNTHDDSRKDVQPQDLLLSHGGTSGAALIRPSQAAGRNFRAHLNGESEVPAVDTRARGQATFQLGKDGSSIQYKVILANIENVRMAHIHLAPADANGPVVAWLYPPRPPAELIPGRFNGILAEGVITDDALVGPLEDMTIDDLLDEIRAGNTYVNVHTNQHPGGEVRGQIF